MMNVKVIGLSSATMVLPNQDNNDNWLEVLTLVSVKKPALYNKLSALKKNSVRFVFYQDIQTGFRICYVVGKSDFHLITLANTTDGLGFPRGMAIIYKPGWPYPPKFNGDVTLEVMKVPIGTTVTVQCGNIHKITAELLPQDTYIVTFVVGEPYYQAL